MKLHEQQCHQCRKLEHLSVVLPTWYMLRTGDDVKWFCSLPCVYLYLQSQL